MLQKRSLSDDQFASFENYEPIVFVRSRFRFDGCTPYPKLKFKLKMCLSNREIIGGGTTTYQGADRLILYAFVQRNLS